MELSILGPFGEVLLVTLGSLLGLVALAILALVITSAVKQIPLGELFKNWRKRLLVGLSLSVVLAAIVMLFATPAAFNANQAETIKSRYGIELNSGQLALLEWPNSAPGQTTIYGDVRLDNNVAVTLIWDDGVYRLVKSDSLAYVELEATSPGEK